MTATGTPSPPSSSPARTSWRRCSDPAISTSARSRKRSRRPRSRARQRDHRPGRASRTRSGGCSRSSSTCSSRATTSTPPASTASCRWSRDDERPSEVLTHDVLRGAKGRQVRPKSAGQKRYIDAIEQQRHHVRHRPRRHRQVVARRGDGGQGAAGQAGAADHPHPAGRRGRGAARLPARRPDGQDRPVPAPAVRRALRHGRARGRRSACSNARPSRSPRWRSCAGAR